MAHRFHSFLAVLTLGLFVLLASGCPSMPLAQAPRTIPRGEAQFVAGLEYYGVSYKNDDERQTQFLPVPIPYFGGRFGLTEGLDIGLRSNVILTNFGLDLKLELIDVPGFALSIAPTVQWQWLWAYASLPVLVAIDFGSRVSLLLSPRITAQFATTDDKSTALGFIGDAFSDDAVLAGAGVGVYFQVSDEVGLLPEVQATYGFAASDREAALLSFSLAITVGAQPIYPGEEPVEPPAFVPAQPAPSPAATPPASSPSFQPIEDTQHRVEDAGPPAGQPPAAPPGYSTTPQ